MTVPVAPHRAPLQVVGVCGQTVALIVNGAVVTFTCLPANGGGEPEGPDILDPDAPPASHAAALTLDASDLDGEQMPHLPELEGDPEVVTLDIETGSEFGADRLTDFVTSAREEGRVPRIRITSEE